jgi:hypothetical protein
MAQGRGVVWGAWTCFGVAIALFLAGLLLYPRSGEPRSSDLFLIVPLSFSVVGLLVALRRPRNPIGWIQLAVGIAWATLVVTEAYAVRAQAPGMGPVPRPDLVVALGGWAWVPAVGLVGTFLILLFPDGRLPSPRWKIVARFSAITVIVLSAYTVVRPGTLADDGLPNADNPLGLEALRPWQDELDSLVALLPICMAASVVGIIIRYRRSRALERLQLKWFTAGACVTAVAYATAISLGGYFTIAGIDDRPAWADVIETIAVLSFALVPIAVGIAMLRHHLYDIDRLINRALVYGLLTVVLTIAYLGAVALLQAPFVRFAGGSKLAVAASTLAVAALFQPLRTRIQDFIDKRFYRRKYDATQTIESFSARLRENKGLEALTGELVAVVTDVMQPTHASLWLPKPPPRQESS